MIMVKQAARTGKLRIKRKEVKNIDQGKRGKKREE